MRNMRKLIPVVVALAMAPVVSSGAGATGPASTTCSGRTWRCSLASGA